MWRCPRCKRIWPSASPWCNGSSLPDALTLAAALLTGGALADLYGDRRVFTTGLTVFAATALLAALAPSLGVLVAARAVQGLGAALLFSASLALLAVSYRGTARRRALSVWGATVGASFAIGPLAGGALTDAVDWRAIFWCTAAAALVTLELARRHLDETRNSEAPPLDVPGALSFSFAVIALIFALTQGSDAGWTSASVLGSVGAGLLLLAAFVTIERRRTHPMLDLRLFADPTFGGAAAVAALLGAATFASLSTSPCSCSKSLMPRRPGSERSFCRSRPPPSPSRCSPAASPLACRCASRPPPAWRYALPACC
jgi:MFS family permease